MAFTKTRDKIVSGKWARSVSYKHPLTNLIHFFAQQKTKTHLLLSFQANWPLVKCQVQFLPQ